MRRPNKPASSGMVLSVKGAIFPNGPCNGLTSSPEGIAARAGSPTTRLRYVVVATCGGIRIHRSQGHGSQRTGQKEQNISTSFTTKAGRYEAKTVMSQVEKLIGKWNEQRKP